MSPRRTRCICQRPIFLPQTGGTTRSDCALCHRDHRNAEKRDRYQYAVVDAKLAPHCKKHRYQKDCRKPVSRKAA